MANDKLGLNDRILFNKAMVRKMSGSDLPLSKIKKIFRNPRLEHFDSNWIKDRVEFQTGLGLGEKIKNTENFDSSDEDEAKQGKDTFGVKVKLGLTHKIKLHDSSDDSQLSTRSTSHHPNMNYHKALTNNADQQMNRPSSEMTHKR